jgi:creatinine amidohydrolase
MPSHDPLPDIQLCVADEATFWPWFRWPQFAAWPDRDKTVVVIPIAGFADHGLGQGLDAEEAVLMGILREASLRRGPDLSLLVVPPIRFALGPKPGCAFALEPDTACDLLEEVATWVGTSGFSKILFFNASPWNEELTKVAGRDLRISRRLQIFCIQLSALGLDFDPVRGGDRAPLKAVVAALRGDGAGVAAAQGREVLASTAGRLASILAEIRDKAPLANFGHLLTKTWP